MALTTAYSLTLSWCYTCCGVFSRHQYLGTYLAVLSRCPFISWLSASGVEKNQNMVSKETFPSLGQFPA